MWLMIAESKTSYVPTDPSLLIFLPRSDSYPLNLRLVDSTATSPLQRRQRIFRHAVRSTSYRVQEPIFGTRPHAVGNNGAS